MRHQHLQNTLSQYGKAVVREMRALAAERDVQATQPATAAAIGGGTSADSGAGAGAAGSGDGKESGEDKAVSSKKKKSKGKGKKAKVAHIVDKMLFNYRNIGKCDSQARAVQ